MITADVFKGSNVKIIEPVNLYGCTLDDNVFVGPFVEIQRNVFIGKNTKISSHSFICTNVDIGENCFVGHGVMFTNDKFTKINRDPLTGAMIRPDVFLKTKIGNNVSIGSNATILPVSIANNVVIGAGSVVTKDIKEIGVTVCGNPAKILHK